MDTLQLIRKSHGLTVKEVAEVLNISESAYWRKENHERKLTIDEMFRLQKLFDLTNDQLSSLFYNET